VGINHTFVVRVSVTDRKVSRLTHLAVLPELSGFPEEEALKAAASPWSRGSTGAARSYRDVCFPSRGTPAKLSRCGGSFPAGSAAGYECCTWNTAHVVVKPKPTCGSLIVECVSHRLTPAGLTGSGSCGMSSIFGNGRAAGAPVGFGLTGKRTHKRAE